MKKIILILSISIISFLGMNAYTSDDHDHAEEKQASAETKEHQHSEGDEHQEGGDHKDEHGHEGEHSDEHEHEEGEEGHDDHEEGGGGVGPDKGITEKAEAGFKLSDEAFKTMGIQSKAFAGGTLSVPSDAVVAIKAERTVFRLRGGWYKRVKIEVLNKSGKETRISSSNFREGDQIVLSGAGFLRIAEIFAEEGASHSHAH